MPFERAQSLCLDDERDFSSPRTDPYPLWTFLFLI
jgi:hypothetical protein